MLKNAYFWGKNVKIASSELPFASDGWGLRSQTPALLHAPTITILSSSFLAQNSYTYKENTNTE